MASCVECYRRKQKCDRKWPCNHCLDRKVGHLCQFNQPKNASGARGRAKVAGKATKTSTKVDCVSAKTNVDTSSPHETGDPDVPTSTAGLDGPPRSNQSSDEKFLDDLGYVNNNADNLLGYLKTMNILGDNESVDNSNSSSAGLISPDVAELLKKVPERSVTDILIQHFLKEANWIYEMIYPTTFLERYNQWWSQPCRTLEDLEFAALLLRLCSYSAQFLPSKTYTAATIVGMTLSAIREQCDAAATKLTRSPSFKGPSSILRVHQFFFAACYLKNEGRMKESWDLLSEAIREAHDLGLHLDQPKTDGQLISEYDLEMGKRTYWNLWLWDKFMSIVLGRWPLIPEKRCNVSLPRDSFRNTNSDINSPSVFCERNLQIRLSMIASEVLVADCGKSSTDPVTVESSAKRLQEELIDTLPPAFRLVDADESWDDQLPGLKRQREMFRISVYATISSLHRPFILMPAARLRTFTPAEKTLIAKHRATLIDATMNLLDAIGRLHELMGGKQNRFFLLSFFTLEPAALLAIYWLSFDASAINHSPRRKTSNAGKNCTDAMLSYGGLEVVSEQRWNESCKRIEEALARLTLLSEVSPIAKSGLKVLNKLVRRVEEKDWVKVWKQKPEQENGSGARIPEEVRSWQANGLEAFSYNLPEALLPSLSGSSKPSTGTELTNTDNPNPHHSYVSPTTGRDSPDSISLESTSGSSVSTNYRFNPSGASLSFPSLNPTLANPITASELPVSDRTGFLDGLPPFIPTVTSGTENPNTNASSFSTFWPSYPYNWSLPDGAHAQKETPMSADLGLDIETYDPTVPGMDLDWGWMGDDQHMMGYGE